MQSHLLARNLSNAKATEKACKNYNQMKIKYNNLSHTISSIPRTSKISESLKRDEVNEIYEFTHQFDGSSGIMALIFRENVKNYVRFVKHNLITKYYLESRLITRIVKGLTGDAKLKYSQRQSDRFDSINAFYKWFDKEFQLSDLRSELHIKLTNWEVDPNIPKLNIVQEYKRMLNLFNLTETFTAQSVLDLTQLTTPLSINAIIKGLEHVHPRIHSFIDNRFQLRLRMPDSFSQLDNWIKDACVYIETSDKNSNKQRDGTTQMNSANTVLNNEYSYYNNDQSRSKYVNSYEKYNDGDNNRYSNNRKYNEINYNKNNDGSRYNKNNNDNSNNEQYKSYHDKHNNYKDKNSNTYNDSNGRNYDYNNDNANSFHDPRKDYNDENSTRYYGTYYNDQGQYYDDYSSYDYRDYNNNHPDSEYYQYYYNHEYNNENNQFDDGDYDRDANEQYEPYYNERSTCRHSFGKRSSATPKYKRFDCYDCGIWGHASVDCEWIHRQFPHLVIEFANMKKVHCKDLNTNDNSETLISNNDGGKQVSDDHIDKSNSNNHNK